MHGKSSFVNAKDRVVPVGARTEDADDEGAYRIRSRRQIEQFDTDATEEASGDIDEYSESDDAELDAIEDSLPDTPVMISPTTPIFNVCCLSSIRQTH